MVLMENSDYTYEIIHLFDKFVTGLTTLVENDKQLFFWRRNRIPVSHRLALYLQNELLKDQDQNMFVDMGLPILKEKGSLVADIIFHDRNEEKKDSLMAIICRDRYLTESELLDLHLLKIKGGCELPLALTILPEKSYALIYRASNSSIDYYHYIYDLKNISLLKKRAVELSANAQRELKLPISVKQ